MWQQKILTIKDPLKRLHRHAEMYISFALENPKEMKCKDGMNWEIGMRSYDLLKKNIEDCMKTGVFQKTNIDVAAFSLWSYVHGIVSLIIRDRCSMFPEEQMRHLVKGALDFMQEDIQ
jgi:hypothetical protein